MKTKTQVQFDTEEFAHIQRVDAFINPKWLNRRMWHDSKSLAMLRTELENALKIQRHNAESWESITQKLSGSGRLDPQVLEETAMTFTRNINLLSAAVTQVTLAQSVAAVPCDEEDQA